MKEEKTILRGDIYYADLSPTVGCEQGGLRPILVLQNNIGNKYSPTIIIAAITGTAKKTMPTHVEIKDVHNLSKRSVALLEQIRTIDRQRLKMRIGKISEENLMQVDQALKLSIGL